MPSLAFRSRTYLLALCLSLPGCNLLDVVNPPPKEPAFLTVVVGDTIYPNIKPAGVLPLLVQVHGVGGGLAGGAPVSFALGDSTLSLGVRLLASGGGGSGQDTMTVVADNAGVAAASVHFGLLAGRAVVRISVPSLGLADSAVYDLRYGFAVRLSRRDTAVSPGDAVAPSGVACATAGSLGRCGNRRRSS